MLLTKLKTAAAVALTVALLGTGTAWLVPHGSASPTAAANDDVRKPVTEVNGVVKSLDGNTLSLQPGKPFPEPKTFTLADDAEVFLDDGTGDRLGFDKGKPADLTAGAAVTLRLSADQKVVRVWVEGQNVRGVLTSVDADKHTITATVFASKTEPPEDRTFAVARNARLSIDGGKAKDKTQPAKEPTLADLPAGAVVHLRLSADGKVVGGIKAEGKTVHGTVKAVDAGKNTLTLHDKQLGEKTYAVAMDVAVFLDDKPEARTLADVPAESVVDLRLLVDQQTVRAIRAAGPTVIGTTVGDAGGDRITVRDKEGDKTFTVAKDAGILIDEKKPGKLAELIDGTVARVRLSADRSAALIIWAEGPSFRGTIKAFDPDNDIITLLVGAKNGQGGEDKEFKLAKETAIVTEINGAALTKKDLRVDKEVILRLAIDQKAAARITVLGE